MKRQPRNSALALVFATLALAACDAIDSMRNGFEHSQAVSAELENSLGLKSFVGFNWNNGSLTSVNVTFQGVPKDRPLPELIEISRQAVLKEFKQEPKQLIVAFAITP
jgi:hypothetical protein